MLDIIIVIIIVTQVIMIFLAQLFFTIFRYMLDRFAGRLKLVTEILMLVAT